jgi:hypothetical protein
MDLKWQGQAAYICALLLMSSTAQSHKYMAN